MAETIFTKIIHGEELAEIVYENEDVIVILSRAPLRDGHSLVIPKSAPEFFYQMGGREYAQLMEVVRQFAVVLNAVFEPKAVAMQAMGLGVAHVHIHLIPIMEEADMDLSKEVFVGLEALRPAGDTIRAYLAEHPLESIQY